MRSLSGFLVLVGAGIQAAAHFVPRNGSSLWDYNHSTFRVFVYYADYAVAVVTLAVAGVVVLTAASRAIAAFATGIAAMAAVLWAEIAFSEWLGQSPSWDVAWNGLLGLLGALTAGVGGVIGWTVGFEARSGGTAGPGWYADPSGQGQRWWDGTTWTSHTAP